MCSVIAQTANYRRFLFLSVPFAMGLAACIQHALRNMVRNPRIKIQTTPENTIA